MRVDADPIFGINGKHVSVSIIGGARASSGSPAERSPVVTHWRFVCPTAVDSAGRDMSKRDIRRFLIVNIMASIHLD